MNTRGFCEERLDGMSVRRALFDCADCFREPTKSKYKESAVYDCLEIRSLAEGDMFRTCLPQVVRSAYNDP